MKAESQSNLERFYSSGAIESDGWQIITKLVGKKKFNCEWFTKNCE